MLNIKYKIIENGEWIQVNSFDKYQMILLKLIIVLIN